MERILSDEEKIRRAIEISQRRNNYYNRNLTVSVGGNNKKEYKLFKKMVLQIIICLLLYVIFYFINTTNYAFSRNIINNTTDILSYDINIEKICEDCKKFINTIFENKNNLSEKIIENTNTNQIDNIILEENIENEINVNNVIDVLENKEKNKEQTKKTSMEIDAEKVLKICKFQKPLSGTITSNFGEREATIKGMTTDHKGIDIAAKFGTNIKSAINGIVSVAEENSEYGKFIKIINGDITTVYAHCKKLKVKKGDKIKLGQKIATVGSTGNSTGPHLHFEIRYKNRYINPRLIIKF